MDFTLPHNQHKLTKEVQDKMKAFIEEGHQGYPNLRHKPLIDSIIAHVKKIADYEINRDQVAYFLNSQNFALTCLQAVRHLKVENQKKSSLNALIITPTHQELLQQCQKMEKTQIFASEQIFDQKSGLFSLNLSEIEKIIEEKEIHALFLQRTNLVNGSVISNQQMEKLVQICENQKIYLIVNEQGADLVYAENYQEKYRSFLSFVQNQNEGLVAAMLDGQPCFNIQYFNSAYGVILNKEFKQMQSDKNVQSGIYSLSILGQALLEALYTSQNGIEEYQQQLYKNYQTLVKDVNQNNLIIGKLQTGYYVYCNYEHTSMPRGQVQQVFDQQKIKIQHLDSFYFPNKKETREFHINIGVSNDEIKVLNEVLVKLFA